MNKLSKKVYIYKKTCDIMFKDIQRNKRVLENLEMKIGGKKYGGKKG